MDPTLLFQFYREACLGLPAWLFGIFLFFFAGVLGSFLNVCVWRIPRGKSIVTPRSRCTACGHALFVHDLIPIVSWLSTGGACRYCRVPISLRYQVVELVNISLWFAAWAAFGRSWTMLQAGALASAIWGTLGVFWMKRKLAAEPRTEAEPPAKEGQGTSPTSPGTSPRGGFSFLEILFVVMILSSIVGPFMLNIQVGFLGSGKNREYIQAYNLARERLEEVRMMPPGRLKSDWDIYVNTERNIFKDEYFGPYARMKESPEKFYARFSDVYTEEKQLTESVMKKFLAVYRDHYRFDYEHYPFGYDRFLRSTQVEDVTDPRYPNNVVKRVTVTVVIQSKATRGVKVQLSALVAAK